MEAVAKRKAPTIDGYLRDHQSGCGMLRFRQQVMPDGIRLSVNKTHGPALGLPFRKTTEMAAHLIQEFQPPAGVQGMV
jgi:hypothetical protein